MSKLPNISKPKEMPEEFTINKENPVAVELNKKQPNETPMVVVTPQESTQISTIPDITPEKEEKPSDLLEENCVMVGDQKIELKPTKLKYFRNKAASAYGIIRAIPLHEFLTYGKGVLDEHRDADQLLYDFLVAAFDNSTLVRDNYDNLDAETIDRICKIFGRLNHIDEKEEAARKNKEAQAKH